ncbi:hypothetical protein [Methylibium rhizosphaerae]|uniref:hypothetical protein n=1 Tax=Methylibium rhizosphaerae TaxID=2570323 RepID=UPI0011293A2F|nr:hypothetical protein [Methylibium rhizosphaerae]
MRIETHTNFADHYVAESAASRAAIVPVNAEAVQVLICKDLKAEVAKYVGQGFVQVGHAQFVGKGNQGVGREAREQAAEVGASIVLFTLVPCKLRAVRKAADGQIDMPAVLADPPSGFSPKGHSVLTSAFLAKRAE